MLFFSSPVMANHPVIGLMVKRHAAKRSLQRLGVFRFNQILDYEAIITLITSISVNQFDRHNLGYKKQVI